MSKNLVKLAKEIDNLVGVFVKRAQAPTPLQQDAENDLPRGAVNSLLTEKVNDSIEAWNNMMSKIYNEQDDDTYQELQASRSLDLRIKLTLNTQNKTYTAIIKPEIEPNRNEKGERYLQPYFNRLAVLAGQAATKSIANASGNSSLDIYRPEHLKF